MNWGKFAFVVLSLFASTTGAQTLQSIENCRQLLNDADRLACYDGLQTNAAPSQQAAPNAASPVTLAKARFNIQDENYQQKIFRPRIELHMSFANSSAKRVSAVALVVSIKDAFGDLILSGDSKLDVNIRPGGTEFSPTFLVWEDNQFMSDDPYSKMIGPVAAGTATAEVAIKKVVYQDGTIESF
ncbi:MULTISPECIES: hypothetical protein [unclassified Mesorhizobium]|uniref:hypothetical protein n=1 Tax=unclassified Mesorhizobium TaxID=325217 RepID=UPI0024166216|nr:MULTISPECIES: hypothetical protein [unclassified Mesorhizobium]MDG4903536.1 hypothetical protein [Mesorhizobium sp. WSM4962]MDG4921414.1 hypothetical protein [Mesorhizobium sp. WSM4989]